MTNVQLGTDLRLDADGDIVFNYQDDLASISDTDNLAQAIIDHLQTGIGELTLHSLYGCRLPLLIGSSSTQNLLTRIEQAVMNALYQEPRIQEVVKVNASFKSFQEITIDIEVIPINQVESMNIVFPFFVTP